MALALVVKIRAAQNIIDFQKVLISNVTNVVNQDSHCSSFDGFDQNSMKTSKKLQHLTILDIL